MEAPRLWKLSSSDEDSFVSSEMDEFIEEDLVFTVENQEHDSEWQEVTGRTSAINEYSEEEAFLHEDVDFDDPFALYKLFFTDCILDKIVDGINEYATQSIKNSSSTSKMHKQAWQTVTRNEVNTFIGILLIMGMVPLPEIKLYWSNNSMYRNARIKKAMKRDRFLSLLNYLRYLNNTSTKGVVRLPSVIEAIVDTFKRSIKPGKNIVINESVVPLRGGQFFRQYIPGKQHKYSAKLCKLCLPEGYTYNIQIYAGKNEKIIEKSHFHDVVMRLLSGLLFEGRTLFIDSYHTSVPLAEKLLENKTFFYGIVKMNRKYLPPQARLKQKRGDIMSFENRSGVKFVKWTDDRPVCMLTTSKNHQCKLVRGVHGQLKPDALLEYITAKKGVDLSGQLSWYYSPLRKTIKWHLKLIIQLICATSLTNAWYIHKRWGTQDIKLLTFRKVIVEHLLPSEDIYANISPQEHLLRSFAGSARECRKRCRECYKKLSKEMGRDYAISHSKKIKTYCEHCHGQPSLCLKCFNEIHKK